MTKFGLIKSLTLHRFKSQYALCEHVFVTAPFYGRVSQRASLAIIVAIAISNQRHDLRSATKHRVWQMSPNKWPSPLSINATFSEELASVMLMDFVIFQYINVYICAAARCLLENDVIIIFLWAECWHLPRALFPYRLSRT